jgi:serine/threonine protein kinase
VRDRYELKRKLGNGAAGDVYLADHVDMGRKVAVKIIPLSHVKSREDLLDEARKLVQLDGQENVVKVHDAGDWDSNSVYVASEYCPGGSLAELSKVPIDPARACELVSQACRGLDLVHHSGLLHLDIRPAIFERRGRQAEVDRLRFGPLDSGPDHRRVVLAPAAPELVERSRALQATDIYGMAMTLAHLLGWSIKTVRFKSVYEVQVKKNNRRRSHYWGHGPLKPDKAPRHIENVVKSLAYPR